MRCASRDSRAISSRSSSGSPTSRPSEQITTTAARTAGRDDGLAARAERAAGRPPKVGRGATGGLPTTRTAARDVQPKPLHQLRELDELILAQLGEALRPQQLLGTCQRDLLLDE